MTWGAGNKGTLYLQTYSNTISSKVATTFLAAKMTPDVCSIGREAEACGQDRWDFVTVPKAKSQIPISFAHPFLSSGLPLPRPK